LFMGGVLGRLLHEFAVTIMSAIVVSGFVSLTLTPMLCSRFMKPSHEQKHGRLFNFFEAFQNRLTNAYDRCLQVVLRHKLATISASAVLLVGTAYLYMVIPKGFLPSEDIDQFNITTEAAEGVAFDSMVQHQLEINQILLADPNVAYVMSQVGFGRGTMNQGGVTVRLRPRAERPQVEQVIQELRPKLAVVPGMNVFMRNDPPIRIGGIQSKALYQFTLQGADLKTLYQGLPVEHASVTGPGRRHQRPAN
jgi:HAE1 family hydrophobic/amphiphilic exporter-1